MLFPNHAGPYRRVGVPAVRIGTALIALGLSLPLCAQQSSTNAEKASQSDIMTLSRVQVIGSRAKVRTTAESVAPVDVLRSRRPSLSLIVPDTVSCI
jgi:iron complex outermembrane receptor protein